MLRFEGVRWPEPYAFVALVYAVLATPLKLVLAYLFGLYERLWRHAGSFELERLTWWGVTSMVSAFLLGALVLPWTGLVPVRVPLSLLVLDGLIACVVAVGPRMGVRLAARRSGRRALLHRREADQKRVIIVGAGAAAELVVKELTGHPQLGLTPIGFVDDDRFKHGQRMYDLPVLGALRDLPKLAERFGVSEIVIAMPRAPGAVVRQVVEVARGAGLRVRTVPGIYEVLSGRVTMTSLREVRIEDLLRREPVMTDLAAVRGLVDGDVVLVTGAGGSIGSELCRQLAQLDPSELVLLGHGENSIYEIQRELASTFPSLRTVPVIADVRDRARLQTVFEACRPAVVFHAAAHKHVPLMEGNPAEAITNNVLGTQNVVEVAEAVGVRRFVLISTDKAVRPTNVMGASKRVAEQVVQVAAERSGRAFVAVRFGNVLGSRGSVVPAFLKQIQAREPVTVTHPEMRRYFMTIPEAVQLVLQAATLGEGGEVFVLDMGEPVKIVDLATDLIRLSGLEVGKDVEIRFSGTRPGEKLYEELFFGEEQAAPTGHPKVLRARQAGTVPELPTKVHALVSAALAGEDPSRLRAGLRDLVPDYAPQDAGTPLHHDAAVNTVGPGR